MLFTQRCSPTASAPAMPILHRTQLASEGVAPLLQVSSSGSPSASCLCLVTPDGQRTMRTCLGASLELKAAEQLPETCVMCARGSRSKGVQFVLSKPFLVDCVHQGLLAGSAQVHCKSHDIPISQCMHTSYRAHQQPDTPRFQLSLHLSTPWTLCPAGSPCL